MIAPRGRLTVNDPGALLTACRAGSGVAQMPLIAEGRSINLFPDCPDERYPLYARHPSRHHMPAKMRAFLDFVVALTGERR